MNEQFKNIITKVKNVIKEEYSDMKIKTRYYYEEDDYYMVLDNKDIFYTDIFLEFIYDLKEKYFYKNNIDNVHIICKPREFPAKVKEEKQEKYQGSIEDKPIRKQASWSQQISENYFDGKEDVLPKGYAMVDINEFSKHLANCIKEALEGENHYV